MSKTDFKIQLTYLGEGTRYLISVPARDLDAADVLNIAALGLPSLDGASTPEAVVSALCAFDPPLYKQSGGKRQPAPEPPPDLTEDESP